MKTMKLFTMLMLSTALTGVANQALAVNNELNPDPTEGASITSNSDATNGIGGENFTISSYGTNVFVNNGSQTTVSGQNTLVLNGTTGVTVNGPLTANNGISNNSQGITNAGAISGVTTLTTSGAATLNSASVTNNQTIGGTLGVTGASTLHGVNNSSSGITNAGAVSGVTTLATSGNATIGGTLGVTGASTLTGALTANGGSTLNNSATVNDGFTANSGSAAGNQLTVGATQTTTIGGGTFNYGTTATGGMLVNGDLGVNGSIYALNPNTSAGVNVGNNGLGITGASNTVTLTSDNNANPNDGRSQVLLTPTTASVTVTNTLGNTHGLNVGTNATTLSGGTTSTSLTLDDNGARFANTPGGGPARVTGVADGHSQNDAVNYGQLQDTYKGMAAISAMSNIPQVDTNKTFALGGGYGNYEGESGFAVGGSFRFDQSAVVKASVGTSNGGNTAVGVGAGYSW